MIRVIYEESDDNWLSVVVHRCSYLDRGHYYRLYVEGSDWFEQETGIPIESDLEDTDHIMLRNIVVNRAEMLSCIPREKNGNTTRYVSESSTDQGETWEKDYLPESWSTVHGIANQTDIPPYFLDDWIEAARRLNGDVFPTVPDFLAMKKSRVEET